MAFALCNCIDTKSFLGSRLVLIARKMCYLRTQMYCWEMLEDKSNMFSTEISADDPVPSNTVSVSSEHNCIL